MASGYSTGGTLPQSDSPDFERIKAGDPTAVFDGIWLIWKFLQERVSGGLDRLTYNVGLTWVKVPFAAGNFTASSGNWTVDSSDQVELSYALVGNTMILSFTIIDTDVSATPLTLRIRIPGGYRARAGNIQNFCRVSDAGGAYAVGVVAADGSVSDQVLIYKDVTTTANYTSTSGDNTDVIGQIAFEVERVK